MVAKTNAGVEHVYVHQEKEGEHKNREAYGGQGHDLSTPGLFQISACLDEYVSRGQVRAPCVFFLFEKCVLVLSLNEGFGNSEAVRDY